MRRGQTVTTDVTSLIRAMTPRFPRNFILLLQRMKRMPHITGALSVIMALTLSACGSSQQPHSAPERHGGPATPATPMFAETIDAGRSISFARLGTFLQSHLGKVIDLDVQLIDTLITDSVVNKPVGTLIISKPPYVSMTDKRCIAAAGCNGDLSLGVKLIGISSLPSVIHFIQDPIPGSVDRPLKNLGLPAIFSGRFAVLRKVNDYGSPQYNLDYLGANNDPDILPNHQSLSNLSYWAGAIFGPTAAAEGQDPDALCISGMLKELRNGNQSIVRNGASYSLRPGQLLAGDFVRGCLKQANATDGAPS